MSGFFELLLLKMILSCVTKDKIRFILEFSDSLLEQNQIKNLIQYFIFVLIMVGYIQLKVCKSCN